MSGYEPNNPAGKTPEERAVTEYLIQSAQHQPKAATGGGCSFKLLGWAICIIGLLVLGGYVNSLRPKPAPLYTPTVEGV